jgi:putative NADPH-quinone reductase
VIESEGLAGRREALMLHPTTGSREEILAAGQVLILDSAVPPTSPGLNEAALAWTTPHARLNTRNIDRMNRAQAAQT